MKRIFSLVLILCILSGCGAKETAADTAQPTEAMETLPAQTVPLVEETTEEIPYVSRFDSVTQIEISDTGISVDGAGETDAVYSTHDIIYYEDKDTYESGFPYGEGENWERHSAAEAEAHTVVNITAPGAYRVCGQLRAGQIRVDLGAAAYDDSDAVVELILSDADITCTVAPAIVFMNVYECDGAWSADTASAEVDTTSAGANLILEGENTVTGSHVARIYKDKEGEKKLWKQDGAVYSYMSMNVYGPGKLNLTADNEGLDTELHLTIHGGEIAICSDNDGINTNEDGVSVTTINGGSVHIIAGLGAEGDGIDSNGWLVINGGTVVSAANPGADAGLDSDMGSFVNGGFVIALGSAMDWAESDSHQVTMNLQFAQSQPGDAAIVVTRQDGTVIFAYDPGADEVLAQNKRTYSGAVLSSANFHTGQTYLVYVDGQVSGTERGGVYDPATVTGYSGGTQMAYTGTDVMGFPGGMGFGGGQMPENFDPNDLPEGFDPSQFQQGEMPAGMEKGQRPEKPEGEMPADMEMPENFQPGQMPEGMEVPENFDPEKMGGEMAPPENRELPEGIAPGRVLQSSMDDFDNEANTFFYMQDKVNFFSGLTNQ